MSEDSLGKVSMKPWVQFPLWGWKKRKKMKDEQVQRGQLCFKLHLKKLRASKKMKVAQLRHLLPAKTE
jgi:hypothetical protein